MWKCTQCDEMVEDRLDACWHCGTTSNGIEDLNFETQTASGQPEVQTCARCGSHKVIPGVRLMDHVNQFITEDLKIRFDRAPNAWLFKGTETATLQIKICCGCGLVELQATDRERLWAAYQEHLNRGR